VIALQARKEGSPFGLEPVVDALRWLLSGVEVIAYFPTQRGSRSGRTVAEVTAKRWC